ncbi:MAG TPA: hypothetical protein VMG08_14385 [Allosphingosinicella sp.]|nr:hypothetical protein [Allosphingosinicella sp.]
MFFEQVFARSEAAIRSCGAVVRDLELAGLHVRLIFAGPELETRLMPAIAHLRAQRNGAPDLVCHIWDSASSGVAMVDAPVSPGCFSERGDIAGFGDDRILAAFQPSDYSLSLFDAATRTGIFWVEAADRLPYWTQAAPFRTLFHWWVERSGGVLVHGAVVGNGDGAVLITGKGGSGKSTTALACLAAGFRFVGDDYVALYPGEKIRAYALYCTAKLNPDNASPFAAFGPRILGTGATRGEAKLVVFLPRGRKGVTGSLDLTSILVPRFGDGPDSGIEPVDPAFLSMAAAASSLAQLPGAGAVTVERIARLTARLPGHALRLGSMLDDVPPTIAGLLRDPHPLSPPPPAEDLPFLSLIVRVGDDPALLVDTVRDVIAEGCPRLEAIIVDHGAPGLETAVGMLPFQPRILRADEVDADGHAGAAGDLVATLRAGDRLVPGALRRILRRFRDDPALEAAGAVIRRRSTGQVRAETEPLLRNPAEAAEPADMRRLALGLARQALGRKRALVPCAR